jgi:hypothetical protein
VAAERTIVAAMIDAAAARQDLSFDMYGFPL